MACHKMEMVMHVYGIVGHLIFLAWFDAKYNILFVFPIHWMGIFFWHKWMTKEEHLPPFRGGQGPPFLQPCWTPFSCSVDSGVWTNACICGREGSAERSGCFVLRSAKEGGQRCRFDYDRRRRPRLSSLQSKI
jgi:hypothetical protein